MPGFDEYQSHAPAPQGTSQFIAAPNIDQGAIGDAVTKLGLAGAELVTHINKAQDQTRAANATTDYLTRLDTLEQDAKNNPDYHGAPEQFLKSRYDLAQETLSTIRDPVIRARTQVEFTRAGLSSYKRVRDDAFTRESDVNLANLDAQEGLNLRASAAAGSPVEKATVLNRQTQAITDAAAAGWITQDAAVKRQQKFLGAVDLNDATELVRADPQRALGVLADPEQYKNLDPIVRQRLVEVARSGNDTLGILRTNQMAAFNPAGAILTTGRLAHPAQGRTVFDAGILPVENAKGDNTLISDQGAVGITQILPGTARDQAKKLGLADVAALDDAALTKRLQDDKELNYKLGLSYWNDLATRYQGYLPAMIAGYHGGMGNTDRWMDAAHRQFGNDFTPAQFAQVIDGPKTRAYLDKVYKQVSADPNALGLSPDGMLRAAHSVGTAVDKDISERRRIAVDAATRYDAAFDPMPALKAGNQPDPQQGALWFEAQKTAAAAGNIEAAKRLSEFNFRTQMQPVIRQAYATPPTQLDQMVATEEARQASAPVKSEDVARLEAFKTVQKEVKARATSDPVTLYTRAGLAPVVAINPAADPADVNFRQALAARGAEALAAQRLYLGSAVPFMPDETAALKERYSKAGPNEKFGLLQTFAQTLTGNAYTDAVKAVTGNDGEAYVGMIAASRPELARQIMQGHELLKSKEIAEKAALVRPAFSSVLGGQIFPDPAQQKAVEQAAIALYVSRAGANGTLYDVTDTSGVEKAIEDVTGPIVKRNGVKVPIAPGIEKGKFIGALDNLTQADLEAMGGAVDRNGAELAPKTISDYAVLKPLAPGSSRYVVGMRDANARDNFAPIFTRSEIPQPLIFDMAMLSSRHAPVFVAPGDMSKAAAAVRAQLSENIRKTREQVKIEDAGQ